MLVGHTVGPQDGTGVGAAVGEAVVGFDDGTLVSPGIDGRLVGDAVGYAVGT